jgi:hypothetical protein
VPSLKRIGSFLRARTRTEEQFSHATREKPCREPLVSPALLVRAISFDAIGYYLLGHMEVLVEMAIIYVWCSQLPFQHTSAVPVLREKDTWVFGSMSKQIPIVAFQFLNKIIESIL